MKLFLSTLFLADVALASCGGCDRAPHSPTSVPVGGITGGAPSVVPSTGGTPCRATINPSAKARVQRPKIVGGTVTPTGAQPAAVALETANGFAYCGGTLVGNRTVVTAAHCEARPGEFVAVGLNDLNQAGGRIAILEVRSSPDWAPDTMHADWSVLVLEASALSCPRTAPARMVPVGWHPDVGAMFRVFGWGRTTQGGTASDVLRQVDVPLADCSAYPGEITNTMFCAGTPGKDSCQGDSGGGLYADGLLAGIVSWGEGCAGPKPGVYTNVGIVRADIDACL